MSRAHNCPQPASIECLWPDCDYIGCPVEHPRDQRGLPPGTRLQTTVANCAAATGSTCGAEDVMEAWNRIKALPKPLVGLVARPELFARVQAEAVKYAGPLGPVPVYQKKQDADCLAFYDANRLRDYLSSNVESSQPRTR